MSSPSRFNLPTILSDPSSEIIYSESLVGDKDFLIDAIRAMLLIRSAEKILATGRRLGQISGPVHLGIGQEAVAVGVSYALSPSDSIFGAHRSHSHILALGTDLTRFFCEILAKPYGLSKGRGGSMHLWDESVGFKGSVPIVAGTVPLAVGAAMSYRLRNLPSVAVAYFGDGACEEGIVHESLNLASIQKDPVVFVVENNFYASHMHIDQRQPLNATSRFAEANSIPYRIVDGNNIIDVKNAFEELSKAARKGNGPGFLEAVTYRWLGHVDWREDIDVGVERTSETIDLWKRRDPINRAIAMLLHISQDAHGIIAQIEQEVNQYVNACWESALMHPDVDVSTLHDCVYSS